MKKKLIVGIRFNKYKPTPYRSDSVNLMQRLSFVITTTGGPKEPNLPLTCVIAFLQPSRNFFCPNCQFARAVATSAA